MYAGEGDRGKDGTPSWVKRHPVVFLAIGALVTAVCGIAVAAVMSGLEDATTPEVEIAVTVNQEDVSMNGQPVHANYVVPRPPSELASPPPTTRSGSCTVPYTWAVDQDGIVADFQVVQVVLSGRSDERVTLTAPKIKQDPSLQQPPAGGSIPECGRGQGPENVPVLYVDLYPDTSATSWRFEDADGTPTDFSYSIANGDAETFLVIADAHGCHCRWSLELLGAQGADNVTFTVDDHGSPFAVTDSNLAVKVYPDDNGTWISPADFPQYAALPPPPDSLLLPPYDACSLLQPSDWSAITSSTVTKIEAVPTAWTRAQLIPGRPPQASSNCSFRADPFGSTPVPTTLADAYARAQLIVAESEDDAHTIATDVRKDNAAHPWTQMSTGMFTNGAGSAVIVRGTRVLELEVSSESRPATSTGSWTQEAALLYYQRMYP